MASEEGVSCEAVIRHGGVMDGAAKAHEVCGDKSKGRLRGARGS